VGIQKAELLAPRASRRAGRVALAFVVSNPVQPYLLTVEEVASTYLRTSRKAVYDMVSRGQLPGVTRVGRRVLFRRDHLLAWLEERRAPSPGGLER
jgi:excisionase family DNA binding protein